MNRKIYRLVFAGILPILFIFTLSLNAQEKKLMTFEQLFKNADPKLTNVPPSLLGWDDDNHYLERKKMDGDMMPKVYSIDVKNGKAVLYRDLSQYKDIVGAGINPDFPALNNENYTRLIYQKEGELYLLNTETKEFKKITISKDERINITLSPDANYIAYTKKDHNLYALDIKSGKEIQYTNDGTELILNGWASWVYYEEILGRASRYRSFWWSSDSKHIAFFRADDSKVPLFQIYNSTGQHGEWEQTRYPKVGDPNPEIKIGIVPAAGGNITWADFNEKGDQYFGQPFWTPDGKQLFTQWMNRAQNKLTIYSIDPTTGKKTEIYTEEQKAWVEWFDNIHFLKGNKGFIIKSDKDGWNHLYLHGMDGKLKNRITEGKWAVNSIELINEDDNIIYFTAKKENSTRTDLYKIKFSGKDMTRLTSGEYSHSVKVSPEGSYFYSTYSNVATPAKIALYKNNGKLIKELADTKSKDFDNFILGKTELFRVKTPDGYDLPVVWTLPVNFDENKKYPVLITIYGGPGSTGVSDVWSGARNQWLSNEGIIQVSIDHRGSGHFGKEGIALMYKNLGKWEMNDYIEVVKWLKSKPYVNGNKICINGGSYGGFVTAMALTYGADYFTHGIAEYSVTDFSLYDSHYTERFMGTLKDNPEGYKFATVMTHADKLKGVLRIVHGTMDDNVHMQNAMQLVDKLEDLGKHFELMVYPGGRHGWGGPKAFHARNEKYRFYYQYLLEKDFPEELFKSTMSDGRQRPR
jgi:dipeptidyl-peptidase 4